MFARAERVLAALREVSIMADEEDDIEGTRETFATLSAVARLSLRSSRVVTCGDQLH
jgi:hypothetical protein